MHTTGPKASSTSNNYLATNPSRTYCFTHQLVTFQDDKFTCRTAETIKEAKDLIEAGFEFVTHINGVELFRKPN